MTTQAGSTTDSLLIEVLRNALEAVAEQMALAQVRSAHSLAVRETNDYATAICDAEGQVVGMLDLHPASTSLRRRHAGTFGMAVHDDWQSKGVGTALLGAAAGALRDMGFAALLSTFLVGNDSSMLWHWRAGFRLLTYPGSPRRRAEG